MIKHTVGEVYFRLVYPDSRMLYPKISSFVYIGMNLSDEDKEDTWYFQFIDDYARYGSFLESDHVGCKVSCLNKKELSSMHDAESLKEQLDKAAKRRIEKGAAR